MLYNILSNLADKFRKPGLDEGAIYAILGFVIVVIGIALLILIVWAVGKIMSATQNKTKAKQKEFIKTAPDMSESLAVADATKTIDDTLSEETIAVITAAIMAYYQQNNPKCEFTVKRIKRI